jgi:ABC-type nitrate/sulfonate/bicarbonate transport system substrate-binding protein
VYDASFSIFFYSFLRRNGLVSAVASQPHHARRSRKINTLNDLKGKVVGVTGAGGIAEFATVEGLARRGFIRDRDYKILYGVGNSPARAHALEIEKIQASPFSFTEKLELERKAFHCFSISEKWCRSFRSRY